MKPNKNRWLFDESIQDLSDKITKLAPTAQTDEQPCEMLLRISLSAAVPLWIEQCKAIPLDLLMNRGREISQIIAEKGDIIQFRSKTQGETAKAFNALAEGLTIMSFVPGGVKFLGMHFESQHPGE